MSEAPSKPPDVGQLSGQDLPQGAFPGCKGQPFRIYLAPDAHASITQHSVQDVSVEICGVLVGRWGRDADGPFVEITHSVRGEAAQNKFAEVTFTHATWANIHKTMDTQFPDKSIVGWYHTHPSFGVFLSDRDRFIQEHFFSGPGQVAYVVDPVRKTEGMFVWKHGKPALASHYWIGDRVQVAPRDSQSDDPDASESSRAEPKSAERHSASGGTGGPASLGLVHVLAYLALFLLGYLIAGMRSSWEQNRLIDGTVAYYGIWKGLRPGLEDAIGVLRDDLSVIAKNADGLAARTAKGEQEDAADQQEQWKELRERLASSRKMMDRIKANYCFSPEEARLVEAMVVDRLRALHQPEARAKEKPANSELPKTEAPRRESESN